MRTDNPRRERRSGYASLTVLARSMADLLMRSPAMVAAAEEVIHIDAGSLIEGIEPDPRA